LRSATTSSPTDNRFREPGHPLVAAHPQEIKKFLDEYVIGQEPPRKAAVAVYNHYKRIEFRSSRGAATISS